jgi:hypothetical protein
MANLFRRVVSEPWIGRIVSSPGRALAGLAILILGFALLFWNEGRAARTAEGLAEASDAVVSVRADRVESANDKKLVHLSGRVTVSESISDPEFGVSLDALRLRRRVEMYQWKEFRRTKRRDKTETTYSYAPVWADRPIDSSKFRHPEGHRNPASWPVQGKEFTAERATLGSFLLSPEVVEKILTFTAVSIQGRSPPENMRDRVKLSGDQWYMGANPARPSIGDLVVRFEAVLPCQISVMARQNDGRLEPYPGRAGSRICSVLPGSVSAAEMIRRAEEVNSTVSWIFRGVGFFLLWLGVRCVFAPGVAILGLFRPRRSLEAGLALFAIFAAACLTLLSVSVAWIAHRPLIAFSLIGLATLCLIAALARRKTNAAT